MALVLGIDTSCDDTSAAVVENGRNILSNVVSSQVSTHAQFGGVVPELASRKHAENITRVIDAALKTAGAELNDLDAVAVTNRPGLIGALLVGVEAAKALAFACSLPLIDVHHIEGHIYAPSMTADLPFPHLCLTVSGGHTLLAMVEADWTMTELGSTLDDAAGEAFDKAAKMLGLGFPGGPVIDRLAQENQEEPVPFPVPMRNKPGYDFSYSGLKTAVRYYLEKQGGADSASASAVAAGFQEAAVEALIHKTFRAVKETGVQAATITGGVACNSLLRRRAAERGKELGVLTAYPPPALCVDNGAMIAGVGYVRWKQGREASLNLSASPNGELPNL